jgi:hypothetical protein
MDGERNRSDVLRMQSMVGESLAIPRQRRTISSNLQANRMQSDIHVDQEP